MRVFDAGMSEEELFEVKYEDENERTLTTIKEKEQISPSVGNICGSNEANERENQDPAVLQNISSFLETMHSKNMTLKKLARIHQKRIEELTQENASLLRASEKKDREINILRAQMESLRDRAAHRARPHELQPALTGSMYLEENRNSPDSDISNGMPDQSEQPIVLTNRSNEEFISGQRQRGPFILSHKVAVRRVLNLMKKINGVCNAKSVGLYFASCIAQASVASVFGFSVEESYPVYVCCV